MESFHKHLQRLQPQHLSVWYAQDMLPGTQWERERDSQLQSAHLILFLVSSDFIDSNELYQKEVLPAMERYSKGEARIIPIILRPVYWHETPFGQLLPLPDGGKPVTDRGWKTQDHAFFDVVSGIKRVISDEKTRLSVQLEKHDLPSHSPGEFVHTSHDASIQLEQIIQNFILLRQQIASYVHLNGPKGFNLGSCESRYNKLYGDTMVFLATYLPESVSEDHEGFVERVYKKAAEELHRRGDIYVYLTRMLISPLAKLEKLAAQINACIATLDFYKQRYFSASEHSP